MRIGGSTVITDALDLVRQVVTSPWVYPLLFALAMVDAFLPVVPGETALVSAAVFAVTGDPSIVLVIATGATGAIAGDHVSYLLGYNSIGRLSSRLREGSRGRAAYDWARVTLARRGGQILLSSRFMPGVRTATTITMGGVAYSLRSFSAFDVAAATLWATAWSLVGCLGGVTFGTDPLKALGFGIGLACVLMLATEAARRLRRARTTTEFDQHCRS